MNQHGPPRLPSQTGMSAALYQQPQQKSLPLQSTSPTSFATGVSSASAQDLSQPILDASSDSTFGTQGQQADLMDFTFDPITTPGNEDMLASMQAIQNPTWWHTMMIPGSANRSLHAILVRLILMPIQLLLAYGRADSRSCRLSEKWHSINTT
jgi:hypothetical protein